MDFRQCVHGNVARESDAASWAGLSQLRMLHYSRAEIPDACEYYVSHLHIDMFGDERGVFLRGERQSLGMD
eukprot:766349-Pleurochrysis_carterae.AAC.1